MNLKRIFVGSVLAFAVGGLIPLVAQTNEQTPSLGTLAKKLKSERATSGKSVPLFTNDNIPHRGSGGISVAGSISTESAAQPSGGETASGQPAGGEAATPAAGASSEESSSVHDEKYYRKQMAALRAQLELHERELNVLKQKSGQSDMQFYANPNKTLQQEYSRSDINKLNEEIAKKQAQIDEDNRAIQDLRDQLRREGGPPGWLR
jgi:hypothetical protein